MQVKQKQKAKTKTRLSVKQKAFVNEYIRNQGNATQAAIKAGYSEKTAAVIGVENLRKPNILKEIEKRTKNKKEKRILEADEILEMLTQFALGETTEEQIIVENIRSGCSKARKIEKRIVPKDRLTAIDKLARIKGLYNDRVEITQADKERSDVHQKTLEALKGKREIEGFSDDEEIESDFDE